MALHSPIIHLSAPPSSYSAAGMTLRICASSSLHPQKQLAYFQKSSLALSHPHTLISENFKRLGPHTINMTTGQPGRPGEIRNIYLKNTWMHLLQRCPEPIKAFPWKKAAGKFFYRLFSLTLEVAKWLFIPVLIISSLSEMSYCGWQNKELFIPIGMLAGGVFAGILKETAIELSENLQEGGCPWHLVIIGALFWLIKFPGPYYPYWGRVFLPHFANGGLWRMLWSAYIWYKKPSKAMDVKSNLGRDSK